MAVKRRAVGPKDSMGGQELEARPIEDWEKGVSTFQGTTTYTPKFQDPPKTPPGVNRGRGMTDAEIDAYKKANPNLYAKGGKVLNRKFNFKKGDM